MLKRSDHRLLTGILKAPMHGVTTAAGHAAAFMLQCEYGVDCSSNNQRKDHQQGSCKGEASNLVRHSIAQLHTFI